MKTIIITGSNGFIGSNLVNFLSKKNKLILLLRVKKIPKKKILFNRNVSHKYFKNNIYIFDGFLIKTLEKIHPNQLLCIDDLY